ncbi:hypothetical protein KC360_g131 [Hortaea werneckii]|nr:hypothetical protein KC360_g131 [Hortaea werneckii]
MLLGIQLRTAISIGKQWQLSVLLMGRDDLPLLLSIRVARLEQGYGCVALRIDGRATKRRAHSTGCPTSLNLPYYRSRPKAELLPSRLYRGKRSDNYDRVM